MKNRPPVNVQARLIDGIITSVPCMRVNQRFSPEVHAHVLVDAAGDVLHAGHLANRIGIVERHRRRRAEAGFEIAEPLARGRMIVLLHRIVFRMERGLHHIVADPIERMLQRFARIALVRDRLRRSR